MSRGILLVNLGTPESSSVPDVRRYLGEFLMDRHVVDLPYLVRLVLVSLLIKPLRSPRSAKAYAQIWDAAGPGTGSPLRFYGDALRDAVAEAAAGPCALAMRYGNPDISSALTELSSAGATRVLVVPLYPQHADSTVTTTIEAARAAAPAGMDIEVLPAFYAEDAYITAQARVIHDALPVAWDHLLLSYHGLPERHLTKADPTGAHCLKTANCCETPSPAHATCYRHQVYTTSRLITEALGISDDRCSVSFQSRLGRIPWLTPYTDEVLAELPVRGVKHLVVACPAFVADNLETLEEIGIAGRQTFLAAGGESFTLVPCMNTHPDWVSALASLCAAPSSTAAAAGG